MTDQSVFDSTESSSDQSVPSLEELVGEGKKYATTEDALGSLPHKERHISELERQAQEMRETIEELQKRAESAKTLDEVLAAVKGDGTTQHTTEESGSPDVDVFERRLAEIEGKIPETYQQIRAQEKREQNIMQVHESLTKQYGDRAAEVLASKARELGVSMERMKEVAAESPRRKAGFCED